MAREFKLGIIVTGDGKGGVSAIRATNSELKTLQQQSAKAASGTRSVTDELKRLSSGQTLVAESTRLLSAGLTTIGAVAGFRAFIGNAIEAERSVTKVNAVLKATQGVSGQTSQSLQGIAAGMQDVTEFADDTVLAAEAVLLTFDKIHGDTFPRTIKVAADLAAVMGTDLSAATFTLGKALQDPAEGLGALTKQGIRFDESTKATIQAMVDSGQAAQAQAIILQELEGRVGGAARAMRDDLGGSVSGLKNAFGDLLEGDGSTTEVKESINDLAELLKRPDIKEGFNTLSAGVLKATEWAAAGTAAIVGWTHSFGEWMAEAALNTQGLSGDIEHSLAFAVDRANNLRTALKDPYTTQADTSRLQSELKDAEDRVRALTLAVRELRGEDIAKAVAPIFNEIDRIANIQPAAFTAPLLAAAETSVDTMGVLLTATQRAARAQEELRGKEAEAAAAAAKAAADRKKAAEVAGKAIASANEAAIKNIATLARENELMLKGVPAAEAAYRAQAELSGIKGPLIEKTLEQERTNKALQKSQDDVAKATEAATKADEDRRQSIVDANKSVEDEITQLTQINRLILDGVDARIAEERVKLAASGADPARIAELEALRARNRLLIDGQQSIADAAKASAQSQIEAYERAAGRIEDVYSDLFNAGLRGLDDFTDQFKDSFRRLLAELALQASKNAILIPIQTAILGQAPGATGGVGSLLSGASSLGGTAGLFGSSAAPAAATGTSYTGVMGSYSFASTGAASAAPLGATSLGAFGIYAGAALVGYQLGSAAANSYRKRNKSIELEFINAGVDASIKQERGAAGGRRNSTDQAHRLDNQLSTQFGIIYDIIEDAGKALGTVLTDFRFQIDAKIKGLSGDALTAKLGELLDEAATALGGQVIPNLERWSGENETAVAAVVRLTNETLGLRESFVDLGYTMQGGREISVELGQQLAEAAGGMDRLQAGMASYYQNFYSEAERQANSTNRLTASVVELGYALPVSRTGFRDLVNGIDLSTEANRQAYATLLSLSQAADSYYTRLEKEAAEQAEYQLAQRTSMIRAEREGLQSLKEKIRELDAVSKTAFNDAMKLLASGTLSLSAFFQQMQAGAFDRPDRVNGNEPPPWLELAQRKFEDTGYYLGTNMTVLVKALLDNIPGQRALLTDLRTLLGGKGPYNESLKLYNGVSPRVGQSNPLQMLFEGYGTGLPVIDAETYAIAQDSIDRISAAELALVVQREQGIITAEQYAASHALLSEEFSQSASIVDQFVADWEMQFTRAGTFLGDLFGQINVEAARLKDRGAEILAPITAATTQLETLGTAFDAVADKLGRRVLAARNTLDADPEYVALTEQRFGASFDAALAGSEIATQFADAIKDQLAASVGVTDPGLRDVAGALAGVEKGNAASLQGAYLRLTRELGQYQQAQQYDPVTKRYGGVYGSAGPADVGITPEEFRSMAQQALDVFNGVADSVSGAMEAAADTARRWESLSSSLTDYARQLDGVSASRLTAEQQYTAAQAEYQSTLALAQASDIEAAERFQGVAEAFREASLALFGSGGGYFADLDGIKGAVDSVAGIAGFEADLPQQQLTAQTTANGYLKSIETNIAKMSATIEKQNQQIIALTSEAAKRNLEGQAKIADSLSAQSARVRASA